MAHFKDGDIEIEGLDELIKAFLELPDESLKYIKEGSMEAAQIVCNKAKQLAPVDTGKTKDLLYVRKPKASKKSKYKILSVIAAKKGAAAIGPLELGHRLVYMGHKTLKTVAPRPFLRTAADENKDNVANIIANSMNSALEKMGGNK